jgi:hypothetical protein
MLLRSGGDPLAVGERETARASAWLGCHGISGGPPTPLIAARLHARRMSRRLVIAITFAAVLAALWLLSREASQPSPVPSYAVALLGLIGYWGGHRLVVRADRRTGRLLARRVAHPTPPGWRTVVGLPRVIVSAVISGGALALAVALLALARTADERTAAVVILAGVVATVVVGALVVADIVRRPALAEDAFSLAADDALRAEDARGIVVSAFPLYPVLFGMIQLDPDPVVIALGMALVVLSAVATYWSIADRRPRPRTA